MNLLNLSDVVDRRSGEDRRAEEKPERSDSKVALWLAALVVGLSSYAFMDLKAEFRENKAAVQKDIEAIQDAMRQRDTQDAKDRRLLKAIARKLKVEEEE